MQQKRSWDRNETPPFSNVKDEANLGRAVDLTRLDGSEEDKIRAMMTQSTQDYDPSKYVQSLHTCTTLLYIADIFAQQYLIIYNTHTQKFLDKEIVILQLHEDSWSQSNW